MSSLYTSTLSLSLYWQVLLPLFLLLSLIFLYRFYHPHHLSHPTSCLPIECWDLIFDNCSLIDVASFTQTSKVCHRHVSAYIYRWVHLALCSWFSDSLAFCHQLQEHGAIVSGSFVLALVASPVWVPRDLDVYVGSTSRFDALVHYLEDERGFEDITPPPPLSNELLQVPYPVSDPDDVHHFPSDAHYCRFVKTASVNNHNSDVFVDLIQTRSPSPGNLVLQFPASCVMNWFTANEIVVTYPSLTVNNIALLHPHGCCAPTDVHRIREDIWLDKHVESAVPYSRARLAIMLLLGLHMEMSNGWALARTIPPFHGLLTGVASCILSAFTFGAPKRFPSTHASGP
ncbi:hypothetical protein M407DRAFT_33298 [Tulasnella calospora MUT 4182]|uniref:F-box domain-containing protein n=1 Tax=Tulasnella calospora MUT 4182 TaxID=1051891 RepID=A0A0C3L681_9AGAM|nr:hypothetical protein M407DRAFT_33298 [Tulasnella calospora MUT 4182]